MLPDSVALIGVGEGGVLLVVPGPGGATEVFPGANVGAEARFDASADRAADIGSVPLFETGTSADAIWVELIALIPLEFSPWEIDQRN